MSHFIDRRLNGKNKSAVNRRRFIKRHRSHIKKAVAEAINQRDIEDVYRGEEISIPSKDIKEPVLGHANGGIQRRVLPGNREFAKGDKIPRPPDGGSRPGGKPSDSGEGEDDFIFQISQEEFLDFMFEDLALPRLSKRSPAGDDVFETKRAGISGDGNPSQLNIVRSLRSAHGRRLAMHGAKNAQILKLQEQLVALVEPLTREESELRDQWLAEIELLKRQQSTVPFLDDYDLKFNLLVKKPVPVTKAVMFCLMDVSGSMDQETKNIAKRFFILLYLFLSRNYEKTQIIFIRHHSIASEVDEQEFFYSRETGGTVVSSALRLMQKIIDERFPPSEWNLYGAQASDGDNWQYDSVVCNDLLTQSLLPKLQYYTYIEITDDNPKELWAEYESIQQNHPESFSIRKISDYQDIYPVFRDLFSRHEQ